MQAHARPRRSRASVHALGAGAFWLLATAAILDAAGAAGLLPRTWPLITWVATAVGVGFALLALLLRMLLGRTTARPPARLTTLELLALGILLGAWLLRGHAEIPPDTPLVAAALAAVGLLGVAAWLQRRWRVNRDVM